MFDPIVDIGKANLKIMIGKVVLNVEQESVDGMRGGRGFFSREEIGFDELNETTIIFFTFVLKYVFRPLVNMGICL
jgi:hypothetical protein